MKPREVLWIAVSVLASCAPESQPNTVPLPVQIMIAGRDEVEMHLEHPLRIALIFRAGTATIAATDAPIPEGAETIELALDAGAAERAELEEPPDVIEILYLPAFLARRPQLVVYEDTDESGDFAFGVDRIAGVDRGYNIAFVVELEQRLHSLTLGQVELYYEATGGRFTELVRVLPQQPQTGRIYLEHHRRPIEIELDLSGRADTDLTCWRTGTFQQSRSFPVSIERRGFVGGGLELIDVCGAELGLCEPAELGSIEPPPLARTETATVVREVQCRTRGELEAYLVEHARPKCDDCRCGWGLEADVYFTRTSSVPPWWPCGMTVDTCTASEPLYQRVEECE